MEMPWFNEGAALTAHLVIAALSVTGIGCSDSHVEGDAGPSVDAAEDAGHVDSTLPVDSGPPALCGSGCEIVELVAGRSHTCARFSDGRVACWGSNEFFELGQEGAERSLSPIEVEGLPSMARLVRGSTYTCGFSPEGTLWCWGDGSEPLLGSSIQPSRDWVMDVDDIVDIQSGGAHSCVVEAAGTIQCWGFRNGDGELGNGTMEMSLEPVDVLGLEDVTEISAGAFFNCARTRSGRLACWGDNGDGQIGDGTGGESSWEQDRHAPAFVLGDVERVTTGLHFACALTASGALLCWGNNGRGSVGIGSRERQYVASPEPLFPTTEIEIVDVVAARMGSHACALTGSGAVLCWGNNSAGQVGVGSSSVEFEAPVEVRDIDEVTGITLGRAHTCAIRSGREVWCWGKNDQGQLGDGTLEDRDVPVRVIGFD